MITLFLLILVFSFLGKPVNFLVDKVKGVNWGEITNTAWSAIRAFGLKAGRTACTPILKYYYVMRAEETTVREKALLYGAILYVISPIDILPKGVLGLLGIVDDAAMVAFVNKKISDKITPGIEAKVIYTLNQWFGDNAPATC